ncbi:hypothetical protein MHYMCMPSP_01030 [Hyalomma marginatum]|nr:hypothetical protein MHYMCMPSP_01030 [Hyalomma marginatum]
MRSLYTKIFEMSKSSRQLARCMNSLALIDFAFIMIVSFVGFIVRAKNHNMEPKVITILVLFDPLPNFQRFLRKLCSNYSQRIIPKTY